MTRATDEEAGDGPSTPAAWLIRRVEGLVVVVLDAGVGLLAGVTLLRLGVVFATGGLWSPWVDLSWMPPERARALLLAFAIGVLGWTLWPGPLRLLVRALAVAGAGCCALDTVQFHLLVADETLARASPWSLSVVIGCVLATWGLWAAARRRRPERRQWLRRALVAALLAPLAVGLHVVAFGHTDYRRPADAVVVFGAAVRYDGTPSLSLEDRTRTGCRLVLAGLADTIVMSGGRGEGMPHSEPEVMRGIALEMGIPDEQIVVDEQGVDTRATVRNVAGLAASRRWDSVLFVSHGYHLARIKMFAERLGLRAYTVPAEETRPLARRRYFFARELAALAWYFLQPA